MLFLKISKQNRLKFKLFNFFYWRNVLLQVVWKITISRDKDLFPRKILQYFDRDSFFRKQRLKQCIELCTLHNDFSG